MSALVSRLACRGLLNRTVFIYTSDNGFKLGNHDITQEKFTQYEVRAWGCGQTLAAGGELRGKGIAACRPVAAGRGAGAPLSSSVPYLVRQA